MTLTALVTDGRETWQEKRTFLFYSKREAKKLFNQYIKDNGWKRA